MELMPPMPLATTTARRSGSTSGRPASAHASRAAISASISHRSSFLACTRSIRVAGSAAAGAAIWHGTRCAHASSSFRTPLRPASMDCQVAATSAPTGVIAPSPVTTTRVGLLPTWSPLVGVDQGVGHAAPGLAICRGAARVATPRSGGYGRAADVVDDVLNRLEVLQLVIGDLHAELVLRGDRDLDHRQAVDVQIVDERLVRADLVGRNTGDLVNDLPEPGEYFLLCHGHVAFSPSISASDGLTWRCTPGAGRRSGYRDHLGGVADASAETDQQCLVARGDLAALAHLGQGERNRCR